MQLFQADADGSLYLAARPEARSQEFSVDVTQRSDPSGAPFTEANSLNNQPFCSASTASMSNPFPWPKHHLPTIPRGFGIEVSPEP
jgi:hypothetical protein